MKNLTAILCLTIAVLLGSAGMSWSAEPDEHQYCLSGTKYSHYAIKGKCSTAYETGDYATALREWVPLAKQGNGFVQFNLGQIYSRGQGVPQDDKTAVKWWTLAAKQGDAIAQSNLGLMYASASSFAEQYPNSWKMNIQCRDGGNKWYEAHFVVDVADGKFTLNFDKRWSWMKNISFKGIIEKDKITIKQNFKHNNYSGLGKGFYKGKIKNNKANLKGYRSFDNWKPFSCKGEFYKVNRVAIFSPLKYLDNASREIIEFTSYNPSYPIQIMNKTYLDGPVKVSGELILPPSGYNIPVVVVVHSSDGPSEFTDVSQWTWRNGFNNELLKNNIGIFQIDSFTGRGVEHTYDDQSKVVLHAGEMDALIAHKILSGHPRIDGKRLGITGLSRGGTASYQVTEKRFSDAVLGPDRYFKASLPMAIDCYSRFEEPTVTPTKILFLLGSEDDYTPPQGCVDWVEDIKANQKENVNIEIIIKKGWVHSFYADTPIEICKDCVIFNNEACSAHLPKGLTFNDEGIPSNDVVKYFSKITNKSIEELTSMAMSATTWQETYQVYYDMYKSMYLDCATKGPKIGGDHAQETIDIAVPFFVNALYE